MQATSPNVFALKNSGLEPFLYADVGEELNGSPLTILSVLARLGQDPWAQAAGWAALPKAAAIDGLSHSIAQMPLAPAAIAASRDIAGRLIQLLPGKSLPVAPAKTGATPSDAAAPIWSPVTMIWCGVAVWMVLSTVLTPKTSTDVAAAIQPPAAVAGSTASTSVPLSRHSAAAPPVTPIVR